jgi:hypothetical protein
MNSENTFEKWFVKPLCYLRSIPNNDGSFVALAIALFLYERYSNAILEKRGVKGRKDKKWGQMELISKDFHVDTKLAEVFWNIMRDGILHQGMPMQHRQEGKLSDWVFSHESNIKPIQVIETENRPVLCVQPWIVVEKVISVWRANIELLEENLSYPWAKVYLFQELQSQVPKQDYLITGSWSGIDKNDRNLNTNS